jgi:2-succinyl-5-enolpyruvyl-6-hydroxy-3-cyclohexene-1-carboxylate synthase
LPIEFARISSDERLTLVIHPDSEEQTTYWAVSEYDNVRGAILNLMGRERCREEEIASMGTVDEIGEDVVKTKIKEWLKNKAGVVQAAVWTNLTSNWPKKGRPEFTVEDAVRYLEEIEQRQQESTEILKRAREYVRNAPEQIQTQVRKRMGTRPEWADNKLREALFEPN